MPRRTERSRWPSAIALLALVLLAACRSERAGAVAEPPIEPRAQPSEAGAVIPIVAVADAAPSPPAPPSPTSVQALVFAAIVQDLVALKPRCPELVDFDPLVHADPPRLTLSYARRVHQPTARVGWTGGVPEPDADGVWLYVDIHSRSSTRDLHRQPAGLPAYPVGDDLLLWIMFEGRDVRSCRALVAAAIKRRVADAAGH